MSEKNGVLPVTSTPPGTCARMDSTRSPLRASVGPNDGTALNVAIAPSGEVTGSVTPDDVVPASMLLDQRRRSRRR